MNNLLHSIRPSIRRWWCLLLLGLVCAVQTKAVSLNIGQYTTFSVSAPQGWITSASWSSSAPELLLEPNGEVCSAVFGNYHQGTVTVTCTFWYSYQTYYSGRTHIMTGSGSRSFTVSCNRPSFTIDKTAVTLQPGETVILSTKTSPTSSAQWPRVFWQSSDVLAVPVEYDEVYDKSYSQKIRCKAVSPGVSTITASIGGGITATCVITVANIEPDNVTLPSTKSVTVGESVTLTPTIYPSNASTTFTWSSENTNIATVSSNGVVTGKKAGTTNITVKTANGKSASCNVTVEKADLTLTANIESGLIEKGTKVTLKSNHSDATIYYTLDGSAPTSSSIHYTSPIPIDKDLTLKAVAMGSDYNPSSVVTRTYQVTDLKSISHTPLDRTSNKYIIPIVAFSEEVFAGQKINDVVLKDIHQAKINGDVFVIDNSLYFVPTETLSTGTYTLSIPTSAIISSKNEPNMEMSFSFEVTTRIAEIAVGANNSFAILSNGSLWAWGDNEAGQLGTGNKTSPNTPVKIMEDVSKIASGSGHTLVVKKDGSLWACGSNICGRLGDGTEDSRKTFVKIMTNTSEISVSSESSMAIDKNGTLWGWGGDNRYQLMGKGEQSVPTKLYEDVSDCVISRHHLLIKTDRTLWDWGEAGEYLINLPVKTMEDIVGIASNWGRACYVIKNDGTLWTWGANPYGILGNGNNKVSDTPTKRMDNVSQVKSTYYHVLAVKTDGSLWAWGLNEDGQIGDGTTTNRLTPTHITDNVVQIAAGQRHSMILKEDGSLWCWGKNDKGELGIGSFTDRTTPTQIPIDVFNDTPVSTVSFKNNNTKMSLNEKGLLQVEVYPANSEYTTISYRSSNENIVSVSNHGVIQAKKVGTATITVTIDGTFTATCTVNVAETLGVGSIDFENEADDVYYDLQGRRVSKPTPKGVYIKNGKKVTIK